MQDSFSILEESGEEGMHRLKGRGPGYSRLSEDLLQTDHHPLQESVHTRDVIELRVGLTGNLHCKLPTLRKTLT